MLTSWGLMMQKDALLQDALCLYRSRQRAVNSELHKLYLGRTGGMRRHAIMEWCHGHGIKLILGSMLMLIYRSSYWMSFA